MIDYDDDEISELRRQEFHERRYRNKLRAHPHPQDPDFPGDDDTDGEAIPSRPMACGH